MQVVVKNLKHAIATVTFGLLVGVHVALAQGQTSGNQVLKQVADVPMPGPAVRFDYQSLDAEHNRLYIAHMNANQLVVFDTQNRQVVANLDGFRGVHGVIAVPEIDRVYASVTGKHQVAAVDMNTLKTITMTGPVTYPDGLAYSPATKRVFVSDEHGGVDAVVDTATGKLLTTFPSVAAPEIPSTIQVPVTCWWQCTA